MKTTDIKGKPYVEVNERIKYFRENFKDWSLESDLISLEDGVCVIRAIIKNPEGVIKATGLAYEKEGSSFINKTSYIENCETSAWGRALGNLGIGIDTSIASADEVQNAMLNQKEKPKLTNKDVDIYCGLYKLEDVDAVKSYYETYKEQVSDKDRFNKEANKQVKTIKEIKAHEVEEMPF